MPSLTYCVLILLAFCAVLTGGQQRTTSVEFGSYSDCSVSCGGGVRVRTALCLDDDNITWPICGGSFSSPCCSNSNYFSGGAPLAFEPCNLQPCPGGQPGFLAPQTVRVTHDGANTTVAITVSGSTTSVSTSTRVNDNVLLNFTFSNETTGSGFSFRSGYGQSYTGDAIEFRTVSNARTLFVGGQKLFTVGLFNRVRDATTAGTSITYSGGSVLYRIGSSAETITGVPDYYYYSPLGQLYRFQTSKSTTDTPTGKLFHRVDSVRNENVALYSQNNQLSNIVSTFSGSRLTLVPGNGNIVFNFDSAGTTVTGSTVLNRTVALTSFSNGVLTVGSRRITNIDRVIRAGEGFEDYTTSTVFSNYDSYFINGRNAIFSTSPRLTAQIQQAQQFLSAGNSPTNEFKIVGNSLQYAGVNVLTLSQGTTTTTNITGPAVTTYDAQTVSFQGNSIVFNGVRFFTFNTSTTGSAFNGANVAPFVQSTGILYRTGDTAFLTTSSSLISTINNAFQLITIPSSTARFSYASRNGVTVLQVNGRDIVPTAGTTTLTLRTGDIVSYAGGSISINPSDSRGPYNGMTSLTISRGGSSQIQQFSSINNATFSNVGGYQLILANGLALLTNNQTIIDLASNPPSSSQTRLPSPSLSPSPSPSPSPSRSPSPSQSPSPSPSPSPSRMPSQTPVITPAPTVITDNIININNGRLTVSLNGSTIRNVSTSEVLRYVDNTITVVRGGNNVLTVDSIRQLGVYTDSGTLTTFTGSTSNTYPGNGTIVANQISGTGLFTNNTNVVNTISGATLPTNLTVTATTRPGYVVLTIGGSDAVNITGANITTIGPGQSVTVDRNGLTIRNTDNTTRRVNGTFNKLLQYFRSSPNVNVSNLNSPVTINGPQTIISNGPNVLVTDRQEVIDTVSRVTTIPSLEVTFRNTSDGKTVLVIGGNDIITISDALLHEVERYEFLTYNNSNVTNNNYVTGNTSGTVRSNNKFTAYTPTDQSPVVYTTGSTDRRFPGPGLFYFISPNESFYVSRPDIISKLKPLFNTTNRPQPPPATGTPEPPEPIPPNPVDLTNSDGSSWDTLCTTPCSRTCGGGVRVRLARCLVPDGSPSTLCTNPTEPSSSAIPAFAELCNTQDCPGGPQRNGIPTPDDFEVTFTPGGRTGSNRCGVGIASVRSSVANDSYIVNVKGRSTETGSNYDVTLERVDGAIASRPNTIDLQTSYRDLAVTPSVRDSVITYKHNDVLYPVNVLTSNGQPADECVLVNQTVLGYSNGDLSYGNRTVPNINELTRLDAEQTVVFRNSLPRNTTESGPLYLCIQHRSGKAFYTKDFIDTLRNPYDQLTSTLTPPKIASGSSTPPPPVTETGARHQIGTTPITILEDIHKFMLQCQLSNIGNPPVSSYMWSKDGQMIVSDNVNYIISGDTLTVQTTNDPQDEGTYTCTVNNGVGSDSASSYLNITQETMATAPTSTPAPPPSPMWVAHPFTNCHKRCSVGIRVRPVRCLLNGQHSTGCNVSQVPLSFELCNIQDCPDVGGGSRRGIPLNENLTFNVGVPNGNFEILVRVSLSSNVTGNYRLHLTSTYPDGTVINNTRTRTGFNPVRDSTSVSFGRPLFGKLEAIKTGSRIDILQQKIIFSVQPLIGDVCYPYGRVRQLIYDNKAIISSSLPERIITPINSVIYINHEGIRSFNERSPNATLFNGPLLFCVSKFNRQAFVTNVASLAEDINGHYYNVSFNFIMPRIREYNGTVFVNRSFASAQVNIGTHVSGVNASHIRLSVIMAHPGVPMARNIEWRVNGEVITSDTSKGRTITPNGFEVIISSLSPNHAGRYTVTVSNAVGSTNASTNVMYRPMNFGIIVRPPPLSMDPSVFNVGIGINYGNVNSFNVRTVVVSCPTTSRPTTRSFTINSGLEMTADTLTHSVGSSPSGCNTYRCMVNNGTARDTRSSVVCFETPGSPSATITGNTMLTNGGSTLLTCRATGYPTPTVQFDNIMLGSVVSSYRVFTNGSILIYNAQPNDNTRYCCRAVNSFNVTTECATITVMVAPKIKRVSGTVTNGPLAHGLQAQLMDATFHIGQTANIVEGASVSIECNLTAGSPRPTYAWTKNDIAITRDAMGRVLRISNTVANDGGTYRCTVNNPHGNDAAVSVLTIIKPPNVMSVMPSEPIGQMINVSQSSVFAILDGSNFCLQCMADLGRPEASEIAWLRGRDGIDVRDICIDFRNDSTLLCFTQISRPYSGTYTCHVSNSAGSDSANATIRVAVAPQIKSPVHDQLPAPGFCDNQESKSFISEDVGVNLCVSVGSRVLLDCELNDNVFPAANVTWTRAGSVLSSSTPGITVFPNNSLLIDSMMRNDTYMCSAVNLAGRHSRYSAINVTGVAPSIMTTQSSRAGNRHITSVGSGIQVVRLQEFNQTLVMCKASGRPSPSISWTIGGRPVTSDNTAFMIQQDGSLLITGLQTTDCAVYTCNASNPLDTASSSVTICGQLFNCAHTGYSQCTVTCGFGAQSYVFNCTSTVNNVSTSVDVSVLPFFLRPIPQARQCTSRTPSTCPTEEYRYVPTDFSSCSHSCGGGRRFRDVKCHLFRGGFQDVQVNYSFCQNHANISQFPHLTEDCNTYRCPDWRAGDWGMCNRECGEGNRTRSVSCVSSANNNATIPERFCNNGTCPVDSERCSNGFCPYTYFKGKWSECSSTCRGGIRRRTVSCYNASSSRVIDNRFCVAEGLTSPPTVHLCGVGNCEGPLYIWRTSHYGACSLSCGSGVQSRTVFCQDVITEQSIDPSFCSQHDKPPETVPCYGGPCPGVAPCVDSTVLCRVLTLFCGMTDVRNACCSTCS